MTKKDKKIHTIQKIVIVGGGTAGWITALSLIHNPFLEITIVQPLNGNSIGVGESTQPDFMRLLADSNIAISEVLTACDATFKCGIYYEDWNKVGSNYWHPFSAMAHSGTYTPAHHYQQLMISDPEKYTHEKYYEVVHPSYDVCVKNNLLDIEACKALHIDADKLHRFLREKLKNKVTVVEPSTIEVFTEDEFIEFIVCDNSIKLEADLFVDCTGFSNLLGKQIGNTEVEYYHENVETAIFARIPYIDKEKEMLPYTKAHAQQHGWIWTIPLASRIGSGYVYTKNSCTPEEAEQQFREYWGVDRMKDIQLKHIPFKSDALKTPWKNNVVAIGLSGGFVEPLEATGINWIVTAAQYLTKLVGNGYFDQNTISIYNNGLANYVHDVQDFVDVHYKLSARRDSKLWQYHTFRKHHPRLETRLEIYKKQMPSKWNRFSDIPWAFNEVSWIDILNGYEFKYEKVNVAEAVVSGVEKEMRRQKLLKDGRIEKCKTQSQLIKAINDLYETQKLEELSDKQQNPPTLD